MASETQDRMLSVIEELGYTTNLAVRSLRSRAQDLVWSIRLDVDYPFAGEVIQGMNRAVAQSKFTPLVYTIDEMRKSGGAHTDPRLERRDERRAIAAACKTCIKPRSARLNADALAAVR